MSPSLIPWFADKIPDLPFFKRPKKDPDEPIRAELFSIERLEQHAESLAHAQRVSLQYSKGHPILKRVKDNGRVLTEAHRQITETSQDERTITPAAEWLIDNFHVVEEQILEIIDDLPPSFYLKLPKLTEGFLKDSPRVYGLAWAFIAHTDSRIDPEWLLRFVQAYQRVDALTIGEVWALAISLRIVLVENLRRLVERLMFSKSGKHKADLLADSLLGLKGQTAVNPDEVLRSFESVSLEQSFVVQLILRLRDRGDAVTSTLHWLDQRLAKQGTSAEDLVRLEHYEQTAMNSTVRNVITSMRLVSSMDWAVFFEKVSVADELLRNASAFDTMDFQTRDLYRHAIEELSEGAGISEIEITHKVLQLAREARASAVATGLASEELEILRRSDPGYYLIAKGRFEFEKSIHCRLSLRYRLGRAYLTHATPLYLGSTTLMTLGLLAVPLYQSYGLHMGWLSLIAMAAAAVIPASDLALALVNRMVTKSTGPRALPKLDFSKGIPASFSTLVVMPTLLSNPRMIQENLEHLEIHYLSNPEGYLQFALLSDWTDAPEEHMAADQALLEAAQEGIHKLNERYGPGPENKVRFFIFHRRRLWNAQEHVWMGWERKRGKLHELNRLLRAKTETSFLLEAHERDTLPQQITYVITLDADTRMPYGTAYRLAGTMAHPLNRPGFDPVAGRVVQGYGIIQPRITPTLPLTGDGSIYQGIFSGAAGVDPYAFAISDVYQDLFEEGSYIGKGIYDLDAFEISLADQVLENRVLSHDLFEGLHARAALATDIELFEEFPSHYETAVARTHRWVRGDWQLLPWIVGRPSNASHTGKAKPLPFIGRWKMADNLRRSLSAPALLLTLVLAWCLPSAPSGVWMLFCLAVLGLAPMQPLFGEMMLRRKQIPLRRHLQAVGTDFRTAFSQIFLSIVFLAHQAAIMLDAIVRTLYRLFVSRRKMLEWTSAAMTKSHAVYDLGGLYKRMAAAPIIAVSAVLALTLCQTNNRLGWMIPFAVLWALSPWIARRISLPIRKNDTLQTLPPEDRLYLRSIARKTWRFFETFVTVKQHFLPPDNFQEIPEPIVADRTSPTNIGLYLLSILAARDFGWLSLSETVERLDQCLITVKALEKERGHLFNWYDTTDLQPMKPIYVSTVDSGNIAGHLWTVASTCRQLARAPFAAKDLLTGFRDVLPFLLEAAKNIHAEHRDDSVTSVQLDEALSALKTGLDHPPESSLEWHAYFVELEKDCATVIDIAKAIVSEQVDASKNELLQWAELLLHQIQSHALDFQKLLPGSLAQSLERLTLSELPQLASEALSDLAFTPDGEAADPSARLKLKSQLEQAVEKSTGLLKKLETLAALCETLVHEMDFSFLFDPLKKVFFIGYQVTEKKNDASFYDLLTSESRLGSFVAIAKNDVPTLHWFRLSRSLISVNHELMMLSWSGTMFEYLMPFLVMQSPSGSLLDQTCRRVVRRQIAYGHEHGIPWGISESAYNVQNLHHTYQYCSFGVPDLGLARGLSKDLVIAPYATALAAMIDPAAAVKNFRSMTDYGADGRYGFFEALDFTKTRLPENEKVAVVQSFMSHHQGMSLVAFANVLYDGIFRERFHAEPMVQACDLLLQERTPRAVTVVRVRAPDDENREVREPAPLILRRFHSPHAAVPQTHLLSNGSYSVMLTAAGSGYSRWRNLAVTRWREDTTRDDRGTYFFLRDVNSGEVWSAAYQPTTMTPDHYEVDFAEDRAKWIRRDGTLETTLEVVVSPEDDAEIRRVTIKNLGSSPRVIDVTSYAEMVLAPHAADLAHPAFSNLFVSTEFVPEVNGLLCTRRPRFAEDLTPWAGHVLVVNGETIGPVQYESNRTRFLGRGRGIHTPVSVIDGKPLSNYAGAVLDPIVSLRCRVRIQPGASATMTFSTLIGSSREEALGLADKYHDSAMFERTVTLAWTHAHIQQHHLGLEPSEAHLFQDLASRILYAHKGLRASTDILKLNSLAVTTLWAHAISGDLPIVIVRLNDPDPTGLIREMLRAHEYWRMKNLAVDLVILNEREPSYDQEVPPSLENLVRNPQGGIFILRLDTLSPEELILFKTAARVVVQTRYGSLAQQVKRLEAPIDFTSPTRRRAKPVPPAKVLDEVARLQFFNGLGGFSAKGHEYVTHLGTGQWTPAPWINVIANPEFGFQVSESGSGYTWAHNSRENQITPWSNDPVSDPSGEIFYLRDEDTGDVWTPTVLPIRKDAETYVSRHGQGYSQFEHAYLGISVELLQFVPVADPVKISRLRLTNLSDRSRRLSLTAYVEWVLGNSRGSAVPFIITALDKPTGALLASNPWNSEFGKRVAFAAFVGAKNTWTADRTEFLGRNGTLDMPAALFKKIPLSGTCGAGLDPCAVLQKTLELRAGESVELFFLLGQGASVEDTRALIARYQRADLNAKLSEVKQQWETILGAVQVRTPDAAMDIMLNRWLLYQTLVCRLWARCGFYQAGGAYGFRDQLQDVMALTVSRRDIAREHILKTAARQFPEGDVQHWWHPPSGRGVRTHISDDLIWLPYVVTHYITVTGDAGILDEMIPFLEGQPIAEGKEDAYFQPNISSDNGTLFEHCARALDRSLRVGSHGLPLMGSGDWNDGMNRVGLEGKGESIWLAWFLHTTLWEFAKTAETRGDAARAEKWRLHVSDLKTAVERHGWDGEWYRRAYFDDGTPLGSAKNEECRMDSIAQSWGVLSGAADPARASRSMAALKENLVRQSDGLILLLTPPFDQMKPNPGYIQGYLPGVRENGGQYTHAAVWAVLAFAALGDGNTAGELFSLLNPIRHGSTRADIQRYKVEPYVLSGDVYSGSKHTGRGGWSWYTGSAGWMYRAGIEWLLGFRLKENKLFMDPCIPTDWPGFELSFRYHSTQYEIKVENPRQVSRGVQSIEIDGQSVNRTEGILLFNDTSTHHIRIVLG